MKWLTRGMPATITATLLIVAPSPIALAAESENQPTAISTEPLSLVPVVKTPVQETYKGVEDDALANMLVAAFKKFEVLFDMPFTHDCQQQAGGTPELNRELGRCMFAERGLSNSEFNCGDVLWGGKESGWRNNAQNAGSTAYGIAQFLDSTWIGVGIAKTDNAYWQIEAGLRYIEGRYGTPCSALEFHRSRGWY